MLSIVDGRFREDGTARFELLDTAWSAPANASAELWADYLEARRRQGFTGILVNLFPQWDRAPKAAAGLELPDYRSDPSSLLHDPAYRSRLALFAKLAKDAGMRLWVVLFWCNWVPQTWASERAGGFVFSLSDVDGLVADAVDLLGPYDPVWVAAGDTDIRGDAASAMYAAALASLRRRAPGSLTAMHLCGATLPPSEFLDENGPDVFLAQSGHAFNPHEIPYSYDPSLLLSGFPDLGPSRTTINGEPCYEGIGTVRKDERITREDVRRALWISVLSGASAGVVYGAHGIWCWREHRSDPESTLISTPFTVSDCLAFEGAWDAARLRRILETYAGQGPLIPLPSAPEGGVPCHAARSETGALLIYAPRSGLIKIDAGTLGVPPDSLRWSLEDLGSGHTLVPSVRTLSGGTVVLDPGEVRADLLIIGEPRI